MSIAGVLVLAALATAAYLVVLSPPKAMRAYCATLPDAIGLYVGSHVTVRGIPVGTVTALAPGERSVRVEFDVDADHPLRGEVSAATIATTLVADRELAVLFDGNAPATWDPHRCVTRTLTAKSITETLDAVSKLATELGGGADPAQANQLHDGVDALRRATSGTGPALNSLINELGTALRSPDAATGHLGELIDALSALSQTLDIHWDDVKAAISRLAPAFDYINNTIFAQAIPIIDRVGALLAWANSVIRPLGGPLLDGLQATVPYLRMLAANVGSIKEILTMIPPVAAALGRVADPGAGDPALAWNTPKVALAQPDAERVCAALNALSPGHCVGDHPGIIGLSQLVLAAAGAR